MTLQSILIGQYDKGLQTNKKPFLLLDSAFQQLENAYCWRERIKKRNGIKLVGRLRRAFAEATIGNSGASEWNINTIYSTYVPNVTPETNAEIEPGSVIVTIQDGPDIVFTDQGDGTLTSPTANNSGRIDYTTGDIWLTHTAGAGVASVAEYAYYPSLPVMGITQRDLSATNSEQTVFFDNVYAYTYDGNDFNEMGSTAATTWTGDDADFFWTANYRGSTADQRFFFATNFSDSDPIRFYNGTTWAALTPIIADSGGGSQDSLFKARIIIPYFGRLVALNTFEGRTADGINNSKNFFNRCRFSQIGDPIDTATNEAWLSDEFGKGGFIDAPTNEAIVSAKFYKNTLIVFFEKSTWNLQYVGEYGLPFVWERTSSDFGSESTFSTVLFDSGVLAVGDKAIVASSSTDVQRIDLDIPDAVFEFRNIENGKERVHAARDFKKEIVYWSYVDGDLNNEFPNRVLLYNYRNGTWAIFRDNVTAFGQLTTPVGISWDTFTSWDDEISWDKTFTQEFPSVVSGNQEGYIHFYQYPGDMESTSDSDVDAIEQESLSITAETRSATAALQIEMINHNLIENEIIYITGLSFVDTSDNSTVTSSLNKSFFVIDTVVDDDNVTLGFFNFSSGEYEIASGNNLSFTPATGAANVDYMGAGQATLMPKLQIRTKDFNPFQDSGKQLMMAYVDFQTDATANGLVSVDVNVNAAQSPDLKGNLVVGNTQSETALVNTGIITGATQADPAVISSPNHGLKTGDKITIKNVKGMTELNTTGGGDYTVTFVTLNTFSLDGIDSSAFTAYASVGNWYQRTPQFYYIPGQQYAWHRFYATVYGQYISFLISYDDALMNTIDTHQQAFEMNAMNLWVRQAGRIL